MMTIIINIINKEILVRKNFNLILRILKFDITYLKHPFIFFMRLVHYYFINIKLRSRNILTLIFGPAFYFIYFFLAIFIYDRVMLFILFLILLIRLTILFI